MRSPWISVFAGVLIHLCLGTLYLWVGNSLMCTPYQSRAFVNHDTSLQGNITVAVTSYLRQFDPSLTYAYTIRVYALTLFFQGFFMLVGGLLEKRIGLRRTILVGGGLLSAGVFLSSYATTFVALLLLYGFMFSAGGCFSRKTHILPLHAIDRRLRKIHRLHLLSYKLYTRNGDMLCTSYCILCE